MRQPTPLQQADVNCLYASQVRAIFTPIRTLDPDHAPTTTTSTSYVHLLDHPKKKTPWSFDHAAIEVLRIGAAGGRSNSPHSSSLAKLRTPP